MISSGRERHKLRLFQIKTGTPGTLFFCLVLNFADPHFFLKACNLVIVLQSGCNKTWQNRLYNFIKLNNKPNHFDINLAVFDIKLK